MPAVIAAIYLLLALRVRVSLEGAFCGEAGSLALSVGAAGAYIRFDGEIRKREEGVFFTLVPRYSARAKKKQTKEANGKSLRVARMYLWLGKTGRMELLSAQIRVGLGDAGGTAVAAGLVHALAAAAMMRAGRSAQINLCVAPDFGCTSLAVHVRCIFSCQAGDMMLAAIRLKKRKKKAGKRDLSGKASH